MEFNYDLFGGIVVFVLFVVGPLCVSIELHRLVKHVKNLNCRYDLLEHLRTDVAFLERQLAMYVTAEVASEED